MSPRGQPPYDLLVAFLTMQNLLNSVQGFDRCRMAVIGDLMLDEYLWGHIERISPEAPVPILNVERRDSTLGGAGNVVENLRVLGVQVEAFGVTGCDETGENLRAMLAAHGAGVRGVIPDPGRKSTRKVRMMSLEHGQQVFRLDEESSFELGQEIEDKLVDMIREALGSIQVILFSDYLKGVLTERLMKLVFASAREREIPCIVAPKDSKSEKYRGATLLVPNVRELAQLMGTRLNGDDWLNDSAVRLIDKLNLQALVVTRGSEGMSLFERQEGAVCRVDIATTARSVYDVTGAGDTAIAVLGACLASGSSLETAVRLANLAAGIKVGKRGTACVSAKELMDAISQHVPDQLRPSSDPRGSTLTPDKDFRAQSAPFGAEHLPKV
jgi:D-beta-D-heptose 7-phosphate kinase/D-beta-D-heptose 1-phosphate adenosyltransferase